MSNGWHRPELGSKKEPTQEARQKMNDALRDPRNRSAASGSSKETNLTADKSPGDVLREKQKQRQLELLRQRRPAGQ